MKKKIIRIAVFLLILLGILLLYRSCTKVKFKELETLQKELMRSDKNIKEIQFYFQRPNYCASIAYKGEINDIGLSNIITHFEKALTYNLMTKIRNTYWKSFPIGFNIYIYKDIGLPRSPTTHHIYMKFMNDSPPDDKNENPLLYGITKYDINWAQVHEELRIHNSYINGFRFYFGGIILFILLCFGFGMYLKKRGY